MCRVCGVEVAVDRIVFRAPADTSEYALETCGGCCKPACETLGRIGLEVVGIGDPVGAHGLLVEVEGLR